MKTYELCIVIDTDLPDRDRKKVIDRVKKDFVGKDGKISHEEEWGIRDLAYTIAGKNTGFYFLCRAETDGDHFVDFRRELELDANVLRYLIVAIDSKIEIFVPQTDEEIEKTATKKKAKKDSDKKAPAKKSTPKKSSSIKKTGEEEVRGIDSEKSYEKPTVKKVAAKKSPVKKASAKKAEPKKASLDDLDDKLSKLLED